MATKKKSQQTDEKPTPDQEAPVEKVTIQDICNLYTVMKKPPLFKKIVTDKEVPVERSLNGAQMQIFRNNRKLIQEIFDKSVEIDEENDEKLKRLSKRFKELAKITKPSEKEKIEKEDIKKQLDDLQSENNDYYLKKVPLPVFEKIPVTELEGWEPEKYPLIEYFWDRLVEFETT